MLQKNNKEYNTLQNKIINKILHKTKAGVFLLILQLKLLFYYYWYFYIIKKIQFQYYHIINI